MTTLAGYCEKYAALLEQGGKGDAQAPQLELLHEIYQLLKTASPEEVKAAQPGLEKSLTTAVVQGPAQPVRRLVSSCFGYLYARGARQTLYTTVGTLMGWLNNKSSPLKNELAKQATCTVLGELSEMHGGAMVSLCHETINLMVKNLKGDLPLRTVSAAALTAALAGSGGIPPPLQQEALKGLRATLEERRALPELRIACLQTVPAVARYAEQLWQGDLVEQLTTLCVKSLDDPLQPVRAAAAAALGDLSLAALEAPYKLGKKEAGKEAAKPAASSGGIKLGGFKFGGSSKESASVASSAGGKAAGSAIEAVIAALMAPFARAGATRELRAGITRAAVRLLRSMKRPLRERHAGQLREALLGSLAQSQEKRPPHTYITHVLRAGLGESLSERGQVAMATALALSATAKASSESVVLCSLKELAQLLQQLREVAAEARDQLLGGERPLSSLQRHPSRAIRLASCHCLFALALAFPSRLAPLLEHSLQQLMAAHAIADEQPKEREKALDAVQAHAHAAAALVSAMPETPFGCPNALLVGALSAAAALAGRGEERSGAAWLLLRALLHLEPDWMASKARLGEVLKMWGAVLGRRVEAVSKDTRENVEAQLRQRAQALGCVTAFLQLMPKQALTLLVKQVIASVLPPNTELLKQCSEHAAALMSPTFRAAFMLFRARLYELLALPHAELRAAKVLNVVIP